VNSLQKMKQVMKRNARWKHYSSACWKHIGFESFGKTFDSQKKYSMEKTKWLMIWKVKIGRTKLSEEKQDWIKDSYSTTHTKNKSELSTQKKLDIFDENYLRPSDRVMRAMKGREKRWRRCDFVA
jgi:hypothetical protein